MNEDQQDLLLKAVIQSYLKHHCGYDHIGWEELSDLLYESLVNVYGHTKFRLILKEEINKITKLGE